MPSNIHYHPNSDGDFDTLSTVLDARLRLADTPVMNWTEKDVGITTRKNSPYVYVTIPGRKKGYVSSGQTTRKRAIEWALREAMGRASPDVLLEDYAKDFFIAPLCPIIKLRERAGGKRTQKHWDTMRQLLEDYILPRWGRMMVEAIEPSPVFDWLESDSLMTVKEFATASGTREPRPLSTARRNGILIAFWEVMQQALFDKVILSNPLNAVPSFRDEGQKVQTVFTDEECRAMFPRDLAELDRIWGGRRWAALYMVHDDTGHRPSEILSLRVCDWHPADRAYVVAEKIDSRGQRGPLKSPKKNAGVKRKVGLVGIRTADLIEGIILEHGLKDEDLLFPASRMIRLRGQPMRVSAAGQHFCLRLDKLDSPVQRRGRTLYALKHGAVTRFRTDLGLDEAALLVGHSNRAMGAVYDHPEDAELVRRAKATAGKRGEP